MRPKGRLGLPPKPRPTASRRLASDPVLIAIQGLRLQVERVAPPERRYGLPTRVITGAKLADTMRIGLPGARNRGDDVVAPRPRGGENRGMLVGRKHELEQCALALDNGRALAIVGEAGVGKTALVRAAVADRPQRLVEAGAFATLSWMPYLPLRRVLGHDPGEADPAFVARELESCLGGATLLLDDLHWADGQTRAVVPLLVGRVALATTIRRDEPSSAELLASLDAWGMQRLEIEPLGLEYARELLHELRPDLTPAEAMTIARRAGGNPLLLEELSRGGKAAKSIERSLFARIHAHDDAVRECLELLALAGRPLDAGMVPVEALDATGLVHLEGGRIRFRHPLLGEIIAARVPASRRTMLHARLARLVTDPGEAARHHLRAEEKTLAYERALDAVLASRRPGERADHLEIAASCVTGAEADLLRMRAAAALVEAGRFADSDRLLDAVQSDEPLLRAEACLLRARGALENNDLDRVRELLDEGCALASDASNGIGLALATERLELDLADETAATTLSASAALLARAEGQGAEVARLLGLHGKARRHTGDPGWYDNIRDALRISRDAGAVGIECQIAESAISPLFHEGGLREAVGLARSMGARVSELRLARWERRFRTRAAWLLMHSGRYRQARDEAEALLGESLEWDRYLVTYVAAQVSVDLGLFDRASELVDELFQQAEAGHDRLRQALWARADLLAASGRPREAIETADDLLAQFPHVASTFTQVTRAWALFELDREVEPPPASVEHHAVRLLAGAIPELNAVALTSIGRPDEAVPLFAEAAELWHAHHERGRLRCAWARGEALRRAGRTSEAVTVLERAERLSRAYGNAPICARVERSFRLAGVRRSARRGRAADGLTVRERELLALAGMGMTNAEIARRLGVSRPTVARTLQNARRKLGAKTRAQAAAKMADSGA